MKKALIVSPYLGHLGGGERYMLSVASVLESLGQEIYFAWDNMAEITSLSNMLGINLQSPQLDAAVKSLYFSHNPLKMYLATKKYDTVVYLSDGSIPLLGSKCNILHMQVPFHGVGGKSWKNQLKKHFIKTVIVNSNFTKAIVDQEFGINSRILYPPVAVVTQTLPKENIILSVGRFEPSLNAKKQNILIDVWKAISADLPDWKLVLAGASSSAEWEQMLRTQAQGFHIEFAINASHEKLSELYSRAKIYWHGAGYEIDEDKNPELTEHFGISTVEAISAGCLPVVVPHGGQREIVKNPDLLWETKSELKDKTLKLIRENNFAKYFPELTISEYTLNSFSKNLEKILL